jgi:hypothetical protein
MQADPRFGFMLQRSAHGCMSWSCAISAVLDVAVVSRAFSTRILAIATC